MTDTQKRLRSETNREKTYYKEDYKQKLKKTNKESFEKFPYTEEQYENMLVLGKFFCRLYRKCLYSIWVKQYFTDMTINKLVVDKLTYDEIEENYSWIMLYKFQHCRPDKGDFVINVVRRYSCTANEYFERLKNRKNKNE